MCVPNRVSSELRAVTGRRSFRSGSIFPPRRKPFLQRPTRTPSWGRTAVGLREVQALHDACAGSTAIPPYTGRECSGASLRRLSGRAASSLRTACATPSRACTWPGAPTSSGSRPWAAGRARSCCSTFMGLPADGEQRLRGCSVQAFRAHRHRTQTAVYGSCDWATVRAAIRRERRGKESRASRWRPGEESNPRPAA